MVRGSSSSWPSMRTSFGLARGPQRTPRDSSASPRQRTTQWPAPRHSRPAAVRGWLRRNGRARDPDRRLSVRDCRARSAARQAAWHHRWPHPRRAPPRRQSRRSFEISGLEREQGLTEQRVGDGHVVALGAAEAESVLIVGRHLAETPLPIGHMSEPDQRPRQVRSRRADCNRPVRASSAPRRKDHASSSRGTTPRPVPRRLARMPATTSRARAPREDSAPQSARL